MLYRRATYENERYRKYILYSRNCYARATIIFNYFYPINDTRARARAPIPMGIGGRLSLYREGKGGAANSIKVFITSELTDERDENYLARYGNKRACPHSHYKVFND